MEIKEAPDMGGNAAGKRDLAGLLVGTGRVHE